MKTLLIINANLDQARTYMAKAPLEAATQKVYLEIIGNLSDTELAIVLDDTLPVDSLLSGKKVWLGDVGRAATHPEFFLSEAKDRTKSCSAPAAATSVASSGPKRVVAVMACLTGVAHMFMAVETVKTEAKKRGWWVEIETRGSAGAGDAITSEEVARTDPVIVATGIEVDLAKLVGKSIYRTSTGLVLKKTEQELDKALEEATSYQPTGKAQAPATESKKESTEAYCHLLTDASCILPMVVAGGLCIALLFAFSIEASKEQGTLAAALTQIGGGSALALMVPVPVGYITFSIADRLGLMPGLVGGMLAISTGSGLIGGIVAGFLASYVTKFTSTRLKSPRSMEALKPILIISLFSSLVVGLTMIYLIGKPMADILEGSAHWLQITGTANAVLLGVIFGGMICTDMGGPVNEAVYTFGVGPLSTQTYASMMTIMVAGMVSPLVLGLAALVTRHKFDKAQQESGKAALILGLCFITEGIIPFVACNSARVLPCCIVGGAITGTISMAVGAKLMVPYGGPFVLLIPSAIISVLGYLLAIITGTLIAGLSYAMLKHPEAEVVARTA